MSKKHFEFVVNTIHQMPKEMQEEAARVFCRAFLRECPKFNSRLFLKACGVANKFTVVTEGVLS